MSASWKWISADRNCWPGFCFGLCILATATIAEAHQAQLGSAPAQKNDATAPAIRKQAEVTFKADGPLALTYILGDEGRPLEIKDTKGKLVTIPGGATSFTASDGQRVYVNYTSLITPAFAAQYLKDRLLYAQILKREPRKDTHGTVLGERIVAILYVPTEPHKRGPSDPHTTISAIIHTYGIRYSEITCSSLDDALSFEKSPQGAQY